MRQFLQKTNFTYLGEISIQNNVPIFPEKMKSFDGDGFTYIWLSARNGEEDELTPLYVGKAGTKLLKRFREHSNGFKGGHARGLFLSEGIRNQINEGNRVLVYARCSDRQIVLGEDISLCSIEEQALIRICRRINPILWNKL